MCCESISCSPTLGDNWEVLEHRYAAKQHLVNSIWGMHKADLERGMLKKRPTMDVERSDWYQVRAEVDMVKSQFSQWTKNNIGKLYYLHRFESDAELLEFIDSLLADNKYLLPVTEHVECGVRIPNQSQRLSTAADIWPASILLPGGNNLRVYLHFFVSSSE